MVPCFIVLQFFSSNTSYRKLLVNSLILLAPLTICLSTWTIRNKITYRRTIVLTAPINECMGQSTPELLAIKKLLLTMGQNVEFWTQRSASHWFLSSKDAYECPIPARHFCESFPKDSIISLKNQYMIFENGNRIDKELSARIIQSCKNYEHTYKKNKPIQFLLLNPINSLLRFLFPARLDDLPLPKMDKAPLYLKIIKGGNLLVLQTKTQWQNQPLPANATRS